MELDISSDWEKVEIGGLVYINDVPSNIPVLTKPVSSERILVEPMSAPYQGTFQLRRFERTLLIKGGKRITNVWKRIL